MRTTITIDDRLLDSVKARARREGKTVSAFIVDAVRLVLSDKRSPRASEFRLITHGGSGPAAGVDLDRPSEWITADDEPAHRRR